jgi:para-aminobenzoate synthetase component 1
VVRSPGDDVVALLGALGSRPVTVVRDGNRVIVATEPDELRIASGEAAFALLDHAPRGGFWAGYLSYDLGRAIERVPVLARDDVPVADAVLARHDARIVCAPGAPPRVVGDGRTRALLEDAIRDAAAAPRLPPPVVRSCWHSSLDRGAHAQRVAVVHDLLDAGDCYQVNLTRRLTVDERVDPVALFAMVATRHFAPHAALLSYGDALDGLAIVSASPECFLRVEGREVETRPIKGTARDGEALRGSVKDRAENVMIVDLARNDLGRVCEPGSIAATALCEVEAHPGLHHLVSTVRGTLRDDVTLGDLVRATFPPASITGAPKPRVMRAIEELEPVRRGVYCGSVGWIDGSRGVSEWSVAIRTFVVTATQTHLGVGGGIVADSIAAAEWAETELKAHRLLALIGRAAPVGA